MKLDKEILLQAIDYEIEYHNKPEMINRTGNLDYEKGFINGLEQAKILINGFNKSD